MRYLVTWSILPVPPEMAEIALALNEATEAWMEAEKKAGSIIEVGAYADTTGGVAIVESKSNDALHDKIYETPYLPFMRFTVTPLADMKLSFKAGQNLLKKMIRK